MTGQIQCLESEFVLVAQEMGRMRREYDRAMHNRRNESNALFHRRKGYRRIYSRFEQIDVMFLVFICFAFIADGLGSCRQALAHRQGHLRPWVIHATAPGWNFSITSRIVAFTAKPAPHFAAKSSARWRNTATPVL